MEESNMATHGKIFLSSTYNDLQEYREAIAKALREMQYEVIGIHDEAPSDQPSLNKSLEDVAACDFYLGIFAWHYGYIPSQNNPQGKSVIELEYRTARKLGKPCFIFLLSEKALW